MIAYTPILQYIISITCSAKHNKDADGNEADGEASGGLTLHGQACSSPGPRGKCECGAGSIRNDLGSWESLGVTSFFERSGEDNPVLSWPRSRRRNSIRQRLFSEPCLHLNTRILLSCCNTQRGCNRGEAWVQPFGIPLYTQGLQISLLYPAPEPGRDFLPASLPAYCTGVGAGRQRVLALGAQGLEGSSSRITHEPLGLPWVTQKGCMCPTHVPLRRKGLLLAHWVQKTTVLVPPCRWRANAAGGPQWLFSTRGRSCWTADSTGAR